MSEYNGEEQYYSEEKKDSEEDILYIDRCIVCSFTCTPTHKCERDEKTMNFIRKAREKHGHRYGYGDVKYINARTNVKIWCEIHGVFEKIPNDHIRKNKDGGCAKCAVDKRRLNKNEFIYEARKIHGDKYGYEQVECNGNNKKVKIYCNKCQKFFEMRPNNHVSQKQGCPTCGIRKRAKTKTLDTDKFIRNARKIHGDRYDYSESMYVNCRTEIKIRCKIHGIFEQIAIYHISGNGCKECAGNMKHTKESFVEAARKIHGDGYGYDQLEYDGNKKKVKIYCNKCQKFFETRPNDHLSGHGCTYCGGNMKHTKESFVEAARKIHGDGYGYDQLEYDGGDKHVKIYCHKHSDYFYQRPCNHLRGYGCEYCGGSMKYDTKTFIEKAKKIHGNKYNYEEVKYDGGGKHVKIGCKTHGIFEQKAKNHLRGCGCPRCAKRFHEKEEKAYKHLEEMFPNTVFNRNKGVAHIDKPSCLYPDISVELKRYTLIVEIDENKHSHYTGELDRMIDITLSLDKPCVFIRYNPDSEQSDLNTLSNTVDYYLKKDYKTIKSTFNHGSNLHVEYLFY